MSRLPSSLSSSSSSSSSRRASRAPSQRAAALQSATKPDEVPMPQDIEAFRLALLRRLIDVRKGWRRCREPICKRVKRCAGPDRGAGIRCVRDNPRPPLTPFQHARAKAQIYRMLQRRAAELGQVSGQVFRQVSGQD